MASKKPVMDSQLGAQLEASSANVVIAQPKTATVVVEVEGTASLIQNAFSQKAIEEMLKKHMGILTQREKKKPSDVIENATIRNIKGGVCMPPTAFKAAMLTASTDLPTFLRKKRLLMTSLFIVGQSIPITFEKMEPRMDMVRTAGMNRTPDVRFRPQFDNWKARMAIRYNEGAINVQSVIDLLQRAGAVGVGEWRPEKRGTFGTFRVSRTISDSKEVDEVLSLCAIPLKTPTIPKWALDADMDPILLAKMVGGGAEPSDEVSEENSEGESEEQAVAATQN